MKVKLTTTIVLFLLVSAGSLSLQITKDASEAMLPQNQEWQDRYSAFLEAFPGDQTVSVVLKGVHCEPAGWEILTRLNDALESAPSITRVLSIASSDSKLVRSTPTSISFDSIRNTSFDSSRERCHAVSQYKPYSMRLTSSDGLATYLLAFADPAIDAVSLTRELENIIQPFRTQIENIGGNVFVTGEPVMSAEIARLIEIDSNLIAVTFLVMLVLIYILTRSKAVVCLVLCLNIFVLGTTYGAMGWLSITLTPATSLVVFLLIPLSTAFVIHAIGYISREKDNTRTESHFGFFIAAVSTGVGFAATGFTPAHDIQMMAFMGVIGIIATALGVFLFVLPILTAYPKEIEIRVRSSHITTLLGNPYVGYLFLGIMLIYTAIGMSHLKFDYSPVANLPDSNETKATYNEASKYFPKLSIPLVIQFEEISSVSSWNKMVEFEKMIEERYQNKVRIQSLTPHLEELSAAFNKSTPEKTFPLTDNELAQYLLFFAPGDLSLYVDDLQRSVIFYVQVPFDTSLEYLKLKSEVSDFLASNEIEGEFIGRVSAFFEAGHRVGIDTLRGLLASSVLILIGLWWLYRSIPLAIAGIAVNVIPVGAGLATLGLLDIPVEIGSAVVAAIAFGILLDDSMHLLVRVRTLVRAGYDPSTAVHAAIRDLATPIAASTLIISIGYSVLFFANLNSFNDFALVISSTLILALLSDILVLPLLVRKFYKDPLA